VIQYEKDLGLLKPDKGRIRYDIKDTYGMCCFYTWYNVIFLLKCGYLQAAGEEEYSKEKLHMPKMWT